MTIFCLIRLSSDRTVPQVTFHVHTFKLALAYSLSLLVSPHVSTFITDLHVSKDMDRQWCDIRNEACGPIISLSMSGCALSQVIPKYGHIKVEGVNFKVCPLG